jgi:hypothetical protein
VGNSFTAELQHNTAGDGVPDLQQLPATNQQQTSNSY